jgi:hypothetical protein
MAVAFIECFLDGGHFESTQCPCKKINISILVMKQLSFRGVK